MERERCLIRPLTLADKFGLWIVCFIYAAVSVVLSGFVISLTLRGAYLVRKAWPYLYAAAPSFKACTLLGLFIFCILLLLMFTICCYMVTLQRSYAVMAGSLYKLIFVDEDGDITHTNYETLEWLKSQGYNLYDRNENKVD